MAISDKRILVLRTRFDRNAMANDSNPLMLTGIAVSPGIAIAQAHCFYFIPPLTSTDPQDEGQVLSELATFEAALQRTISDLKELREKVTNQVGAPEASIFEAHLSIAFDATLSDRARRLISGSKVAAISAVQSIQQDYEEVFSRMEDSYLRHRMADVQDVLRRIALNIASPDLQHGFELEGSMVLVADELLPSDVVTVSGGDVQGIVTQSGSRTSHAAILARSYGIPAVAGVKGILGEVSGGDLLIVDGSAGKVFIHPSAETIRAYQELRREYVGLKNSLAAASSGAGVTSDGVKIDLCANISCSSDAAEASRIGADGIGLYRTEFFFLTYPGMPTEDEQIAAYREVLAASPPGPVTIRTLDLGGDKTIPYLTHSHEANPFLGWRSIRLSFEYPDLFLRQIRAVLRAAKGSPRECRLLFPMITNWDELVRIHEFVDTARSELDQECLPYGPVKLGMMLEVPAAAVMLDQLVELVEFVAIGSNDLVQYLTAADRDNPKVSHLCQALSPAVLRVLQEVITTCNQADIPVSLCGETAGSPRAFPLLLAMGLRSFSMSPSFIPAIREFASHMSIPDAKSILDEIWQLKSASQIQFVMDQFVHRLAPELAPLLIS